MDLGRGVLTRIDRKLLAGLGEDEVFQMVRVPVTAAKWSTWKRYCDAVGVSMGRAIAALIDRELFGVFGESTLDNVPVFAQQAEEELADRERRVASREQDVEAIESRLRRWDEHLRLEEVQLRALAQHIELAAKQQPRPRQPGRMVGRNERCPCGSGFKYKHCHGLAGRQDR